MNTFTTLPLSFLIASNLARRASYSTSLLWPRRPVSMTSLWLYSREIWWKSRPLILFGWLPHQYTTLKTRATVLVLSWYFYWSHTFAWGSPI